jgi:histidinol-phosphatase (PHP family)
VWRSSCHNQRKFDVGTPVQLILKHGGRFALSDDSHGPHTVGLNYDRLVQYLRQVGVTEVWFLQHSDMGNAAGRAVHAVRDDGFSYDE